VGILSSHFRRKKRIPKLFAASYGTYLPAINWLPRLDNIRDTKQGLEVWVDADFAGGWNPEEADHTDEAILVLVSLSIMPAALFIGKVNCKQSLNSLTPIGGHDRPLFDKLLC